jgi:nucleoside-diphosphate-sugar epimerase
MRVLIVGCGYVGLPLGAELVRLGHEVLGLRRSAGDDADLKAAGITPLHADITQPETLAKLSTGFDWVVNCAASGGGDADAYRQLYLQGTRNLIEWLWGSRGRESADSSKEGIVRRLTSAATIKKFVYTSSTGVYGQNDGSVVKETSPTDPATETAKILVETEKALLAAAREKHFPAVVLRVAGIYGPERGYLLKQYLRNEARIEGVGGRFLNMIHRDDLIGVIIAALKSGRAGEIYNAVDDEPVSQFTFFQWLAGTSGKDMPPSAPEDAEVNRKRGVTNKRVSNRRLKMELGYQFKYPNFRKGYTAEIMRLEAAGQLNIEPDNREQP